MATIAYDQSDTHLQRSAIRWVRVVIAGVASEASVVVLLLAILGVYTRLVAPGLSGAQYQDLAQSAGYYVAPPAGAVMTLLLALWACRGLDRAFVANGLLVGVVSTLLSIGFVFSAKPEHRLMYIVAAALKIAAGYTAGILTQKRVAGGVIRR